MNTSTSPHILGSSGAAETLSGVWKEGMVHYNFPVDLER